MDKPIIAWFSCGITSAVACKIALEKYENVTPVYIEIDSAHSDNARFIKDCEAWYGVHIRKVRSTKYKDQFDVIEKTKYVNGVAGARCTKELKKEVRYQIEKEGFHAQVFGFEFKLNEVNRAVRFQEQYPASNPLFPLIEQQITKEDCIKIILENGIKIPKMYALGFNNNNCIGCVKGGAGYWNHIRKHFPDTFDRMANLERKIGRSCIKNKFLDSLDHNSGRHSSLQLPDCGTTCELELENVIDEKAIKMMQARKPIQLTLF